MSLIKISHEGNIKHVYQAAMGLSDLATVELTPGAAGGIGRVTMGSDSNPQLAAGVVRGQVNSGDLVRVVSLGEVSGVRVATSAVQAGNRLQIATSGRVNPLINPALSGVSVGRSITSGGSGAGIRMFVSLE